MDQYIKDQIAGTAAETTLRMRRSVLGKLAKEFKNPHDFSFLNDTKKVSKWLDQYQLGTKLNNLFHIIGAASSDPSVVSPETIKYYNTLKFAWQPVRIAERTNNVKSAKQEISLKLPLSERKEQLNEAIKAFTNYYDISVDKKMAKRLYNTIQKPYEFVKQLQDILICACYILQPALRNDWNSLIIITNKINMVDSENYMYIRGDKMMLVLNVYKNASVLGHQEIAIQSDLLKQLIHLWVSTIKIHAKATNQLAPKYLFYYSVSKNKFSHLDEDDTLRRALGSITNKVIGQSLTINDFRHLWEIQIQQDPAYAKLTACKRKELHNQLLHGTAIAQLYNVI